MNVFLTINLFALKFSSKTKEFCMWKQDLLAIAIEAFTLSWTKEVVYTFPPTFLLHRTLFRIEEERVLALVITMVDPTSTAYIRLHHMAVDQMFLPPKLITSLINKFTVHYCHWICCVIPMTD
jgi:hypothetical protein